MLKKIFSLLLLLPLCAFGQFQGDWTGDLSVQGAKLKLVFHISFNNGQYSSTMDSPQQGAMGIPTTKTEVSNKEIIITIGSLNATYKGTLEEGEILGMFTQNGLKIPLNLNKVEESKEEIVVRPQDPKEPFPYQIEDFSFKNKKENIVLRGTLTLPPNCPNCPIAVLHSGSGPQNRDSEIFNHRPFAVLADELSKNGIAVLRYDDRGVGDSEGSFSKATTEDFTADLLSAIAELKTSGKIDSNLVGVIGHSEGGVVAIKAANSLGDLAFMVLLASPGVPGGQVILKQQLDAVENSSLSDQNKKDLKKIMNEQMDILLKAKSSVERKSQLSKLYKSNFKKMPPSIKNMGLEKYTETQIKGLDSPWMEYFVKYDPRMDLAGITIPVLALNGSLDTQVDAKQNLGSIESVLKDAGNNKVEIHEMVGLNHLFQKAETGMVMEYGMIEETFNPDALHLISSWINKIILN